ncbi:hypothetical protein GQ42DRAFT_165242, partial [Ramicandelaber brevisporus]
MCLMSHLYHVAQPVYTRADGPDQKRANQSALNNNQTKQAKRKKSIAMTTTPTGGTGAESHSNHPLDNDEGRRRQGAPACDARGGGEKPTEEGRTKR